MVLKIIEMPRESFHNKTHCCSAEKADSNLIEEDEEKYGSAKPFSCEKHHETTEYNIISLSIDKREYDA